MKVIIIDDEVNAIKILADKLKAYDFIDIVGTATSGKDGIDLIRNANPDLMFLDVELPDMSGVDFLGQMDDMLRGYCQVVMYTGHAKYMLPAFRSNAFDYLMKPIDDEELETILRRAVENKKNAKSAGDSGIVKQNTDGKLLFYTNAVDFRLVHIRDIGLFQYNHEQRVWEVVIAGRKEPIKLKRNVNNDTLLAIDNRFVQVSQRFVININYLLEVSDNFCRLFPPFDKIDYVKVGRLFRKKLIERFSTL